jgi:hypothetical protein
MTMAETTAAPNNKPVAFGKKPQREPAGVVNAAPMKKLSPRGRKTAKGAIKRGLISEKAAKRLLGDA